MSIRTNDSSVDLDPEIVTRLAAAFDWEQPPNTMAEFVEKTRATFEASLGRPLGPQDMCTTDDSPHATHVGNKTYHYQCVADAFILGALLEEPVTVRTTCPVSDVGMSVEFDGGELSDVSAPPEAVMSFGVKRTVSTPESDITPETMYGQLCGYSHVFASYTEYEEWVDATPEAVTQAVPLNEGFHGVGRMIAAGPFDDTGGGATNWTDCC